MKKILQNEVGIKFGFVLFLFILLQIPVSMIENLINERSHRQAEVRYDIARSSSGEQTIMGPFIAIHYRETVQGKEKSYEVKRQKFILPTQFKLTSDLDSFEKYRGIYTARLYQAKTHLLGAFDLKTLEDVPAEKIDQVDLVVAISDSRGINNIGDVLLGGQQHTVEPGTRLKHWAQGFHVRLDHASLDTGTPFTYDLSMMLQGMGELTVKPLGKQTEVRLSSAWPHPSFIGDYLPVESEISDQGFAATWMTNNLSTNINELFNLCMSEFNDCGQLDSRQMGVSLIEPVDHYLKSHRAVNYSLLVITLVFASFFLLELFQAKPIHPVQYGFVGLALAVFYLLLISLSEHTGFNWAYLASAMASSGLLGVYVSGMLGNNKHGGLFAGCLLVLYTLLFGLLKAESYALLMGTLLCFIVLSFVMVLTRNINWYERKQRAQPDEAEPAQTES